MSIKIHHVIVLVGLLLPAVAIANDQSQENPIYGGFALGFASADSNCDDNYNCEGEDTSFKLYLGKALHPNLATEIAFYDLGTFRKTGISGTTTAESDGINLSLIGKIPVSNVGFFYGRAGIMIWQTRYQRIGTDIVDSNEDGTDFTYGAGFAWQFNKQYDLRIEYERLQDLGNDYVAGGSAIDVLNFGGSIYFE